MTRLHRFHRFSDIRHAVIVSIVLINQVHHNLRHYIFLFCATLSNHERQSDQRIVIQKARTISTVKNPIVFQKPKEQKRCDAFVAVTERVVLDRQVKQIGCLFLDTRIEITPAEGLVNCPHCALNDSSFS